MTTAKNEFAGRLQEARRRKIQVEQKFREGYFFAAPHRARNVLSTVSTADTLPKDHGELNTSFAAELCGDFSTAMINVFLPGSEPWARRKAGPEIPEEAREAVDRAAQREDDIVFQTISASNFYPACAESFTPDLALGTVALWIERNLAGVPVKCQSIPVRELEINLGPYGDLDERFISRWTLNRHLPGLTKGIDLPAAINAEIGNSPKSKTNVTWCFYRDHEFDDETWCHGILVKDELIHSRVLKGAGSCPLIVGRINPSPEFPWGVGPLIAGLPDFRVHDALCESKIRNIELWLEGPIAWPDDSFANIENGLEPRMAYPIRPGSENAIKQIYSPNPPDAAIYEKSELEFRLRRLFYLDFPQQSGDTPPSATQWLDQSAMAQRRIGTPGLTFWREFCAGVFTRFQYILEQEGMIRPVKIDGKSVALHPYNPAQRAAEQQEIAMFSRFAQFAGAMAPEEFKIRTDAVGTLEILARKFRVSDMWVQRSPEDIQAAITQIQQLQASQPPTAPEAAGPGQARIGA